jgi:L-aspartate oxidase
MKWQGDKMDMLVDVVIVGTGISGLYSALNLRSDLKILLITKSKIRESNTYLAQGGIATAKNIEDIPSHIEDTLIAGRYKNDSNAVEVLVKESIENINALEHLGLELDKKNGSLLYTKEGAHSTSRIVHVRDNTGKALVDALLKEIEGKENISIYEDTYMVDILKYKNKCCGLIALTHGEQIKVYSKVVILATGGIGGLFKNSTSQRSLTGDGIYVALKNNVQLKDLNYIQFHPTALFKKDESERRFLISESMRGEGGKLLNSKGQRFIDELLPRDVVTKAILHEMEKCKMPYVNLDVTSLSKEYLISRFPSIYEECIKNHIDISESPIPVSPAQHYFMGGIQVDLNSVTSMENLYAVGEVSCTGVHGANRLASNSLLEGLVFSRRAAKLINDLINEIAYTKSENAQICSDAQTLKKNHINLVLKTFKGKVGNFKNELVNN